MKLKSDRPLAFFDIESTGLNKKTDRIIDLAIIKLHPDGRREDFRFQVNPGIPISLESIAIHGIGNDDVKDWPPFSTVARDVVACLEGCDLAGFGIVNFDIPLLEEELRRVGLPFEMGDRRVIDVQRIFHKREPRDLSAALNFYCDDIHDEAHDAMGDTEATVRVLEGQYARYSDLPVEIEELAKFCETRSADFVDRTGRLRWNEAGEVVVSFGDKQGRTLRELVKTEANYLQWILRKDFPRDMQDIIRDAIAGKLPTRPAPAS